MAERPTSRTEPNSCPLPALLLVFLRQQMTKHLGNGRRKGVVPSNSKERKTDSERRRWQRSAQTDAQSRSTSHTTRMHSGINCSNILSHVNNFRTSSRMSTTLACPPYVHLCVGSSLVLKSSHAETFKSARTLSSIEKLTICSALIIPVFGPIVLLE